MPHDRKFRFGLQLVRAESGAQVVEWARRAEDLGYSTINVPVGAILSAKASEWKNNNAMGDRK